VSCGGAYGYHAWEVKIGHLTKGVLLVTTQPRLVPQSLTRLQRSLLVQVLASPLIWVIKLSVYSLIFHAFRPLAYIRRLIYAGLLVTGIYTVGCAIANGIVCGPQGGQDRASYIAGMAGTKCGNPTGTIQLLSVTSGGVNLLQDLFLLLLPLPAISKLNLPTRRKTGVFLIFLTGAG
jgi:hypothetical protein